MSTGDALETSFQLVAIWDGAFSYYANAVDAYWQIVFYLTSHFAGMTTHTSFSFVVKQFPLCNQNLYSILKKFSYNSKILCYFLETTPITSISTRNSGLAKFTCIKVLAGGYSTSSGAYFW